MSHSTAPSLGTADMFNHYEKTTLERWASPRKPGVIPLTVGNKHIVPLTVGDVAYDISRDDAEPGVDYDTDDIGSDDATISE